MPSVGGFRDIPTVYHTVYHIQGTIINQCTKIAMLRCILHENHCRIRQADTGTACTVQVAKKSQTRHVGDRVHYGYEIYLTERSEHSGRHVIQIVVQV